MRENFFSYHGFVVFFLLSFLYFSYFSNFLGINSTVSYGVQLVSLLLLFIFIFIKFSLIGLKKLLIFLLVFAALLVFYLPVILNYKFVFDLDKTLNFFLIYFACGCIGIYLATSKFNINLLNRGLFFLSSIFVILTLIFGDYSSSGTSRVVLGDLNPIWNARFLGICLLYVLIQVFVFRRVKLLYIFLALLATYTLINTGSRGPMVSVVFSFIFICIFFNLKSKGKFIVFLKSGIIFLISYFYISVYTDILYRLDFLEISSGRTILHEFAVKLFLLNPFGLGLGGFGREFNVEGLSYPHNIILESLVETGFLFTFAFFSIIFYAFKKGMALTKDDSNSYIFLFSLFIYSFVNSMFSGDLTSPKELYILIFFYIFSLKNKVYHQND